VSVADFAERVGRDLHDGPLQDVFATRLRLDALAGRVPPDIAAEINQLSQLQGRIILRMRRLIRHDAATDDHRPSELLADVVADASIALGFSPRCSIDPRVDGIEDASLVSDVVHAVRESLSNVARHAQASRVRLSIAVGPTTLRFTVRDDGVGISETARRGNGLANLRARAERNGGSCSLRDAAGGGTVVDWSAPRFLNRSDSPPAARRSSSAQPLDRALSAARMSKG
jgi:signal transduction histidine kinase